MPGECSRRSLGSSILNENTAKAVLDAAHAAWSSADIERLLGWYAEDLTYICNTGGPNGEPLTILGREGMRAFLAPVIGVAESMSVVDSFHYADGVGRARVSTFIRHKKTGHTLSGSYRQLVTFGGDRICRLEEFHDAAKMAAFWRLVTNEVSEIPAR